MKYKTLPSLEIKVPSVSMSVVRPDRPMDLLHGNVVATFSEEYEIEYGAAKEEKGYCVFIEKITAVIGYSDFIVQVDRRHSIDSCEYARILEHENEHIAAHLSVVEDEKKDMRQAISSAANNVMPIFAAGEHEIEETMNDLEAELSARPEIRLLRQKLNAEQEIRNKKIDVGDRGERIRECAEDKTQGNVWAL